MLLRLITEPDGRTVLINPRAILVVEADPTAEAGVDRIRVVYEDVNQSSGRSETRVEGTPDEFHAYMKAEQAKAAILGQTQKAPQPKGPATTPKKVKPAAPVSEA